MVEGAKDVTSVERAGRVWQSESTPARITTAIFLHPPTCSYPPPQRVRVSSHLVPLPPCWGKNQWRRQPTNGTAPEAAHGL